ncbi:MAG: hypothetical protein IPK16_02770 [Anaerolineales bacterium]|nr:hypothetical protein [Anaerolineales bacterium]
MRHQKRSAYAILFAFMLISLAIPVAGQDATGRGGRIFFPVVLSHPAQAPNLPPPDSPELRVVVAESIPSGAAYAALAYWTADRMAQARPLDLAAVVTAPAEGLRDREEPVAGGAAPSYGGLPGAASLAAELYAADWAAASAASERNAASESEVVETTGVDAWSTSPPFTSYYVNDNADLWKSFPWRTVGRLFFNRPLTPGAFSCSGAVGVGRAVWTAGHCVYTPGEGFNKNMIFVPAYRNGAKPYGAFAVLSRATLRGWTGGKAAFDLGMLAVADVNNLKVSDWVGNLGFRYNAASTQLLHFAGYPDRIGRSQFLIACSTVTNRREPLEGPDPIGVGCDMDGGADGAPGLSAFAPNKSGAVNYVNSIFSHVAPATPNLLYGVYFDTGAKGLYDWGKAQ